MLASRRPTPSNDAGDLLDDDHGAGCARSLLSASTVERAVSTCSPSRAEQLRDLAERSACGWATSARNRPLHELRLYPWHNPLATGRFARFYVQKKYGQYAGPQGQRDQDAGAAVSSARRSDGGRVGRARGQLACRAAELHRQVGILIDRRGTIQHVIVGDASKIMLPDFGRIRAGAAASAACAWSTRTCAASR